MRQRTPYPNAPGRTPLNGSGRCVCPSKKYASRGDASTKSWKKNSVLLLGRSYDGFSNLDALY